jgi:hypothetical protein
MNDACGLTGCENSATSRCFKCSLPLCAEHAVEYEAADGPMVCCQRCAAYLRAKSPDGEKIGTGGGCGD